MGSGKTWAGARKFVTLHCSINRGSPGLITAPTYADINRVVIPEIKRVCEEWRIPFVNNPYGTKHVRYNHILIGGTPVIVISAEEPARFAGFEVGHIWVDEAARIKNDKNNPLLDGPTQIRSRLRHKGAKVRQLILTTTPEGRDNWIYEQFIENPSPNKAYYVGRTVDNKSLPQDYIENLKNTYSADLAKQYLDGECIDFAGALAHGYFSEENIKDVPWDFSKVYVGCDFNVMPMCWIAAQVRGDELYVMDELVIENNASVDTAVVLADEKGWSRDAATRQHRKMFLYPDKSSKNRSTTSDTEFNVLVKTARQCEWQVVGGSCDGVNPAINSRIATVSRLIKNTNGVRRLFIHPRCVRLIKELQSTKRVKSGAYDPGKDRDKGHILDALGYVCWGLFGEKHGIIGSNLF